MKQIQESYKTLRSQTGSYYNVRVVAAGNTYGMDKLSKLHIDPALFDGSGPQIGNAYSAQCDLELYVDSANWPRMCRFTVDVQLCSADEQQTSSWLPMGTFYTDTRRDNTYGLLTIRAYDGMLKMETSWTDRVPENLRPSSWPITSRAWATMIQSAGLATFEDLTVLDNTVAFIGLNTASSIRDVLKSIAAANGGNWMMTTDDRLRFVKFKNPVQITAEATTADYVWLGRSVSKFKRSPALSAVSGVHLEAEDGVISESGDGSGYMLYGSCDFTTNVGVAAVAFSNTDEYVYRPFEASNAILDPITELGDTVVIDGQGYQVMRLSWTLGKHISADIFADYDEEVDHEYQIPNPQAKTMRKTLARADERYLTDEKFATEIQQTESVIRLAAEHEFPTYSFLDEELQKLQDQIDGNIQSWSGNEVPTLNNAPAIQWATQADKADHVGDLYFVNSDAEIPEAGNYYRFEENDGVYSWQLLTDSALSEALNKAAAALAAAEAAQETADDAETTAKLKGRIWLRQPVPPYDEGDLWFDSTQADIKVCIKQNGRQTGNFVDADWQKRDKYTDDSAFNTFYSTYQTTINAIQTQVDRKADTYYQEVDPAVNWGAAVAGIAIAGVDIVGVTEGAEHKGDLWYRTSDGTTWYWQGKFWLQQDVPDEVFDKIDGKAQIFIVQPYPPYNEGDLWFSSDTSDIMTCINPRESGKFVAADWEKRNKYTDDTEALAVGLQLTQFHSEFEVATDNINAEVEKRIISDNYENRRTFGWKLTSDAHTWYSDGKEVMKINWLGGLSVEGKVVAHSGEIGDCEIADGRLIVGLSNLESKVVVSAYTETQYYLSESDTTLRGGDWATEIQDWITGHYYWTRSHTHSNYSDGTVEDTYIPSVNGVYNKNLTEIVAKSSSSAQAVDATKRQQTVFHSTAGGTLPTRPTAWVAALVDVDPVTHEETGKQGVWTSIRPPYSRDYPALYYAVQTEKVDGTITCTDPKLDATTTVIDGAHIITGTLDASAIATGDLAAGQATIGGFKISVIKSQDVITGGSIAYNKERINDNKAGVYIGTDGISLGANNVFKVTEEGAVTASNLSLTGGSISIKKTVEGVQKNVFSVSTEGAINANFENGTLTIGEKMRLTGTGNSSSLVIGGFTIGNGAIYTNDQDDYSGQGIGRGVHLSGSGIRLGENFRVNDDGDLYANNAHLSGTLTIGGNQAITQADLYNAISQSAANYGKWNSTSTSYGNATNSQSSITPAYFRAMQIVASSSFYSAKYTVNTGDDNTEYDLEDHYHTFTAQDDGKVVIGKPTKTQGFFNIADTKFYKDAVSAAGENAKANYISHEPTTPTSWSSAVAASGNTIPVTRNQQTYRYVQAQFDFESGHKVGSGDSEVYTFVYDDAVGIPLNVDVTNVYKEGQDSIDYIVNKGYEEDESHVKDYTKLWIRLPNNKLVPNIDVSEAYDAGAGSVGSITSITSTSYVDPNYADYSVSIESSQASYSGRTAYGTANIQLSNQTNKTVTLAVNANQIYLDGRDSVDELYSHSSYGYEPSEYSEGEYNYQKLWVKLENEKEIHNIDVSEAYYQGHSPVLGTQEFNKNGTYNASSYNLDGFSSVTVSVSGGGGGGDADVDSVEEIGYSPSADLGDVEIAPRSLYGYLYSTLQINLTNGVEKTVNVYMEDTGGGGGQNVTYRVVGQYPLDSQLHLNQYVDGEYAGDFWIRMGSEF